MFFLLDIFLPVPMVDMARYQIILLIIIVCVTISSSATGDCTFALTKNHGLASCINITSEDYLRRIFEIKPSIENSRPVGKVTRVFVEILDSHIPTIEDWLFLPWDDHQLFFVQSVKIVNSSVNTVKALSKLGLVETLDLSKNNISDYRFLNKMKKLRHLYLSHNKLSPESYLFSYLQRDHARLQLIDLSYCDLKHFGVITNLIDNYDLSFNPNLTTVQFNHSVGYRTPFLNFSGNNNLIRLEHLRAVDCFHISLDLSNCNKSLDLLASNNIFIAGKLLLNNNHIPSLDERSFNLSKLISKKCLRRISLDISHSKITYISSHFFSSYMLNVLNLSNNNLSALNGSIFRGSDVLHLDISNSNVTSINSSVFNYLTVHTLDLSRNNISSLDGVFDYIESMSHLDVSSNPIEALNENTFKNCRNLENLDLKNIFIKSFGENTFLHLSSLKVLIVSFKDSIYSSAIRNIHMTELIIANSSLTRLDAEQFKGFYKLKKLTFVDSYSASAIDNSALKGLYNLKRVTNLKDFGKYDINVFQQLYSLENLDLSKHKLTKLSLEVKDLYALRTLNLSSNAITSVDVNSFLNLKQLEILSISDNELSTIAVGTFRGLTKLTHLYLNKNQFQQLIPGIFSGLDSLILLDLSHNDLIRTKPHLVLGMSLPKLMYLYLQGNGVGNEYIKSDDVVRRNEFNIIANHNKLKYIDINKNGWRCSTLIDVLTVFKNRNISYDPATPELTTSNINGISCTT